MLGPQVERLPVSLVVKDFWRLKGLLARANRSTRASPQARAETVATLEEMVARRVAELDSRAERGDEEAELAVFKIRGVGALD
jgi:hypothetical protein